MRNGLPAVTDVAIVGNPRPGSRTANLAATVLDAVRFAVARSEGGSISGSSRIVDLGALLGEIGAPLGTDSAQRYAEPLALLNHARIAVVATPTYKGSYTGLLKSFLDQVAAGALREVVAIPVITVGSPAHAMAADVHLRPLLVELGAVVPTAALVVGEQDLADPTDVIDRWLRAAALVLRRLVDANDRSELVVEGVPA